MNSTKPTPEESRTRVRDIAEAARDALAGGAWQPLTALAAKLADLVPQEKSLQTYARLARAGGRQTTDTAEQEAIGRERVVQEVYQHLVGRGKAEACGRGESRQYRLREKPVTMMKRPKSRKEWVPLERLTFDARLQLRIFPDGKLWDEATVELYREARSQGSEFPPLEAVEEVHGKKTTLWIFSGFHRGESLRRDGQASVEVVIYPGTFLDARLYALRENGNHGKHRTASECRKSFDTLLDTPELLERVMSAVKENGGTYRSIGAACGISQGAVVVYLKDRGLQADRKTGKLIPIPQTAVVDSLPPEDEKPEPRPTPKPEATLSPQPAPSVEQTTSATGNPDLDGAKDALAELQKLIRSVGRNVESLLRSKSASLMRAAAKAHGHPFAVKDVEKSEGINDPGHTKKVEYWPVLQDLQQMFADVSSQVYAGGDEP